MMNPAQAAALVLLLVSTLPLVVCLLKVHRLEKYKAKAIVTSAFITAVEKRSGIKSAAYYLIAVKYTLVDTGIVYAAQTISVKKYAVGDSIPLMYIVDKPENFSTDFGQSLKWLLPLSIMLLLLVSCLCYWLLNPGLTYDAVLQQQPMLRLKSTAR